MIDTDLAYGSDPAQQADIYVPTSPTARPLSIFTAAGGSAVIKHVTRRSASFWPTPVTSPL